MNLMPPFGSDPIDILRFLAILGSDLAEPTTTLNGIKARKNKAPLWVSRSIQKSEDVIYASMKMILLGAQHKRPKTLTAKYT